MVSMKDLEIGTRVRIRKDLKAGNLYGELRTSSNGKMDEYYGKEFTIARFGGDNSFKLDGTSTWWWTPEMIEEIIPENKFRKNEVVKIIGDNKLSGKHGRLIIQHDITVEGFEIYGIKVEGKNHTITDQSLEHIAFINTSIDNAFARQKEGGKKRELAVLCVENDNYHYFEFGKETQITKEQILGHWFIEMV